ncbi:MAG TPA: hypothetical protein VKT82_24720, partial [Ktedonobacterales bacterium]|nr:hypothetical protein [Ktedonobacterales bacterium]
MEESTQEKPAPDDGKALEWLESPEGRRFTLLQGEGLICPCCFDELTAPLDIEQGICRDCWLMALEAERKAEIETRGFRCT